MTEVVLIGMLNALAFWQKNLFLYLLMVPANIMFGFSWASAGAVGSAIWVEGIIIVAVGTFALYRVVAAALLRGKGAHKEGKE